jgi:DNA-binding transcriptional LysR family regulator
VSFDLRQIRAFCAIIEHGNFSRAAAAIRLTQPTLSTHMKNLEETLGVRLFDRTGRAAVLTPAGQLFHEYARQILALSENASQAVVAFLGEVAGEASLLASTVPGEYILPRWLGSYCRRFPKVRVNLAVTDTAAVVDRLLAVEAHLGVIGSPVEHPSLACRPLCADEIILVAAPELLKRAQVPGRAGAEALSRLPLIAREPGSGTQKTVEGALAAGGIDPARLLWAAVFGSTQAALEGAAAGVGGAFVSARAAQREVAARRVRRVDLPLAIRRSFYLVTHATRSPSPVARHLAERLFEERKAL